MSLYSQEKEQEVQVFSLYFENRAVYVV